MFVALYNFIKQDLILVFSVHPQSWSTYFFFILCMSSGILNWNSVSTSPRRTFKPHSFDNSSIFSMWVELSNLQMGSSHFVAWRTHYSKNAVILKSYHFHGMGNIGLRQQTKMKFFCSCNYSNGKITNLVMQKVQFIMPLVKCVKRPVDTMTNTTFKRPRLILDSPPLEEIWQQLINGVRKGCGAECKPVL